MNAWAYNRSFFTYEIPKEESFFLGLSNVKLCVHTLPYDLTSQTRLQTGACSTKVEVVAW
jgi:hypothetical protein